jgi:hypothetical protein
VTIPLKIDSYSGVSIGIGYRFTILFTIPFLNNPFVFYKKSLFSFVDYKISNVRKKNLCFEGFAETEGHLLQMTLNCTNCF